MCVIGPHICMTKHLTKQRFEYSVLQICLKGSTGLALLEEGYHWGFDFDIFKILSQSIKMALWFCSLGILIRNCQLLLQNNVSLCAGQHLPVWWLFPASDDNGLNLWNWKQFPSKSFPFKELMFEANLVYRARSRTGFKAMRRNPVWKKQKNKTQNKAEFPWSWCFIAAIEILTK